MSKEKVIYFFICFYILITALAPTGIKIHGIALEDSILAAILILYVLISISNKNNRIKFWSFLNDFFHSSLGIIMTLLVIIMLFSTTYSLEKKLAMTETIRFITYIGLFFIVKYYIKENKFINNIRRLLIICIIALCIFGIVQYFTGIGLDKGLVEQYSFGAKIRIAATFGNPNSYAGFLILFVFPILMIALQSKDRIHKIVYFGITILIVINLILTFSRNSWLAFAIGLFILVLYYSWKLIAVFGIMGGAALLIPTIGNRIKDFTDINQNISRLHHWQTAFLMIKDHPILGVGNGNYVSNYDSYILKYPYLDYAHQKRFPSHNSYLKVTSELGIMGITFFIALLIVVLLRIKKASKYIEDTINRAFYSGFLVSSIAFLIMNFFDNILFTPKVAVWFWVMIAISEGFTYRSEKLNTL